MLKALTTIFKKKEVGKHRLFNEFMQWQMHGIGDDVLIPGLRPEYTKYVNEAKQRKPSATQDELLQELETILSQLKG